MIRIGGVTLKNPVMNAACSIAKTPDDVEIMCRTRAGAVLVGSITVEPRAGNPHPRWHDEGSYALNSFGMPNKGFEYYKKCLPKMVDTVHAAGKKFILSVAGFNVAEYKKLARLAFKAGVDLLELNFGCPNAKESEEIASFDTVYMKRVIQGLTKSERIPLMVKLSPYSNPKDLSVVGSMLAEQDIAAVVTSNSFPNGYMQNAGKSSIATNYAGVNGKALQPIALGQVRQFRSILPKKIAVVGVGGIESVGDVDLYLESGATAVQVATHLVRSGHKAIDEIIS